jgi:hypothetical protein
MFWKLRVEEFVFLVTIFSGAHQRNFAGACLFLAQLLPQKPHQQNLTCASKISDMPAKIINPNDFDMPPKKA